MSVAGKKQHGTLTVVVSRAAGEERSHKSAPVRSPLKNLIREKADLAAPPKLGTTITRLAEFALTFTVFTFQRKSDAQRKFKEVGLL